MSNKERRIMPCEMRMDGTAEDAAPVISGHGSVFNTRSENLGGFREVIMPGAFDDVLNDDVRALFNHDPNFVLGRTISGTLTLEVDERGLKYEILSPNTQTIRDLLLEPLKRGDISQSSFAFRVARDGEEWDEDDEGVVVRTIHKFKQLFDVSPVTYPAYPEAGAATRAMDAWKEENGAGALKRAINEKRMRERFLHIINS